MRILFITPYVPSLIRVRPFNFLKQLSKRHEITLVSLVYGDRTEADELEIIKEFCSEVHVIPVSRTGSYCSCLKSLLTRMPLQAAYTNIAAGKEFVTELVEKEDFDLVHVEHIRGAHLASGLNGITTIYDSVDCITRLIKQRIGQENSPIQKAVSYGELFKMPAYEANVAASFDSVVITSELDKRIMQHLIRRHISSSKNSASDRRKLRHLVENLQDSRLGFTDNIIVVRNGVDCEYFRPMESSLPYADIAFSGKMSYFPNILAVLGFYKDVFPRIKQVIPSARFRIIGANPPESIYKLTNDPSVEVTGYVPDIRPYLASSRVVICPLTVAVGIQNKMLEAMAMAKPVVASSLACKGITEAVNNHHLVQCDDPEQVAQAVVSLLDNHNEAEILGKNALKLVFENYSWEASAEALQAVYERAIIAGHGNMALI